MTAPTFKKATYTAIDVSGKSYGAPDIKHIEEVLDGTHAGGHRLQTSVIENIGILSKFDWLIKGMPNGDVILLNIKTGAITLTTTQLYNAIDYIMNTLPVTAPNETVPITRIALNGIIPCITRGCIINRSAYIDGLGSALIRKTTNYQLDSEAIFRVHVSNVTIRNLAMEDAHVYTPEEVATYPADGVRPQGIISGSPAPGTTNWLFENLYMKNIHHHGINLSRVAGVATKNVTIRNCIFDNMEAPDMGDGALNMGVGCGGLNIIDNVMLNSNHSGIDVWAASPPIRIIGNHLYKGPLCDGGSIGVTAVSDQNDTGLTEEIVIRDNWCYGPGITQDPISCHGGSANIVVEGNHCIGGGRYGIRVASFNVFRNVAVPYDAYSKEVRIRNNYIQNAYGSGINITLDPALEYGMCDVSGNIIVDTLGSIGIDMIGDARHTTISKNQIYRINSRGLTDTSPSGIRLRKSSTGPGSHQCIITGNHIVLDDTFGPSTYSIWAADSSSNKQIIAQNQVTSGKPIFVNDTNSIIVQNVGFRTYAFGTATVATNATNVVVPHGLDFTPSLGHIKVVRVDNTGSATKYWHSSPTATTFTINVNAQPGVSTATFGWRIRRYN